MASANAVAGLYPRFRGRHGMTIDPTMQAVFAALFATASGAIGWLITKLWVDRDAAQAKLFVMLEKQFDDAARRKDLFDALGNSIKDLAREVQSLQRGRP
jgi:hypothetical protein